MYSPVTVAADENGMIIRQSKNNPEYGYVVLKQTRTMIQSNPANVKNVGWLKTQKMSTLIKGTMEELKLFGFTKDAVLPGKIVVKESTTPFSEEDPDQHLKIAGDTGIVCCLYGEPIYRITYYTADPNEQDEFVQHDNVDAIRQANGTASVKVSEKPSAKAMKKIQETFDIVNEEVSDSLNSTSEIEEEIDETFEL
jgi:hypothetical protein